MIYEGSSITLPNHNDTLQALIRTCSSIAFFVLYRFLVACLTNRDVKTLKVILRRWRHNFSWNKVHVWAHDKKEQDWNLNLFFILMLPFIFWFFDLKNGLRLLRQRGSLRWWFQDPMTSIPWYCRSSKLVVASNACIWLVLPADGYRLHFALSGLSLFLVFTFSTVRSPMMQPKAAYFAPSPFVWALVAVLDSVCLSASKQNSSVISGAVCQGASASALRVELLPKGDFG